MELELIAQQLNIKKEQAEALEQYGNMLVQKPADLGTEE